ncbi:hypothetical protein SAM40697_5923 [Streptomyces ambofaciens]|uniref:Ferric siderophore reductase C-terminal domain-containing protein n=1 Tax=Streptomyces ambofaciens TaxID=1889 RepID=A0ABM6B7R2_STRAM|nr:(2Fe-2S)-binding protein [Streptomyces ambofaciens]ANB09876.1 hypothetical protein SAM40697_5923 [Streptomyces ambofaciens]
MDLDPDLAALRPLGGFSVLHASKTSPYGPFPTLAHAYAPVDGEPGQGGRAHHNPGFGGPGDATPDAPAPLRADPLAFRVHKVAAAIRAPDRRVAASVAHQGLAARLWSVTLGCAALYGHVPDLTPSLLHWDPDATAPDDLWLAEVRSRPGDVATIAEVVLRTHLTPLTATLHARYRVATGLLRGNAASALAGAGRELDRWARRHGRTDTAARARSLTSGLLAHPLLAGTGTLTGTAFRRRSCCLYYRVPGGGLCGDCCFSRPPGSPGPPRAARTARSPRDP